ncbi:cysteine hydrolase [Dehalococcoidia bacterium]|nr:cysteine hydrolase [Dehalococcoidia bacterium]
MKKTAIIIVDMLKDNVDIGAHFSIGEEGRKIIPNIQRLLAAARGNASPVIFANDSFLAEDFIFQGGRIKPHAIMGTEGAGVIAEFEPHESDIVLEKRRFSAFLGTNLDATLRDLGVDCIAVAGISTPVCVLTTVLDGISHEFKVIILEDCCATYRRADHDAIINLYRKGPLYPLLQAMSLDDFLSTLSAGEG